MTFSCGLMPKTVSGGDGKKVFFFPAFSFGHINKLSSPTHDSPLTCVSVLHVWISGKCVVWNLKREGGFPCQM